MNKKVQIKDLGLKDYKETWDYQEELFQGILSIKSQNRKDEANAKETPNSWNPSCQCKQQYNQYRSTTFIEYSKRR